MRQHVIDLEKFFKFEVPLIIDPDTLRTDLPHMITEGLCQIEGVPQKRTRRDPAVLVFELDHLEFPATQHAGAAPQYRQVMAFGVDFHQIDGFNTLGSRPGIELREFLKYQGESY